MSKLQAVAGYIEVAEGIREQKAPTPCPATTYEVKDRFPQHQKSMMHILR